MRRVNGKDATMRKPTKQSLGDLLVQSMSEIRDSLRRRAGGKSRLTLKTVEIPDPPRFSAAAVHRLRDRLGLSQGLFAKLLGVSRKLIEAWEAGTRVPSPMACRLLDAVTRNPSVYVRRRRRAA
jgi:putative transcriptional regulator